MTADCPEQNGGGDDFQPPESTRPPDDCPNKYSLARRGRKIAADGFEKKKNEAR